MLRTLSQGTPPRSKAEAPAPVFGVLRVNARRDRIDPARTRSPPRSHPVHLLGLPHCEVSPEVALDLLGIDHPREAPLRIDFAIAKRAPGLRLKSLALRPGHLAVEQDPRLQVVVAAPKLDELGLHDHRDPLASAIGIAPIALRTVRVGQAFRRGPLDGPALLHFRVAVVPGGARVEPVFEQLTGIRDAARHRKPAGHRERLDFPASREVRAVLPLHRALGPALGLVERHLGLLLDDHRHRGVLLDDHRHRAFDHGVVAVFTRHDEPHAQNRHQHQHLETPFHDDLLCQTLCVGNC